MTTDPMMTLLPCPVELLQRIKKHFQHGDPTDVRFSHLSNEEIADVLTAECKKASNDGDQIYRDICAVLAATPSPQPAPETDALDTMTADEWKAITRGWELQCREAEAAARIRDEALEEAAKRAETMNAATCGPREIGKAIRALKSAASAQSADKGKDGGR